MEQTDDFQALPHVEDESMAIDSRNSDEDDVIVDDTDMEEGFDEPENDVTDNWSQEVLDAFDPTTCEVEQRLIGDLMKKCRSLVKLVNKSSVLMAHVNKLKQEFNVKRSLQLDCKNRWNSTHRLIQTILLYKKVISKLNSEKHDIGLINKQTKKLTSIELEKSDWGMLESIQHALQPFVQATKLISGSKYATVGVTFFAVVQIREFLENGKSIDSHESNILARLKLLLLAQMDRYLGKDEQQWHLIKV